MRLPAAGESAAQLPWLWPDAHSLSALGQPLSPGTWPTLRRDPAALLLVHRQSPNYSTPSDPASVAPARFLEPRVLDLVLQWFHHDRGCWLDCRHPTVLPIYRTALTIAHHARIIAGMTRCCDSNAAWTAGLLVPLGWFAVAAIDPVAVAGCRADPLFDEDGSETQQQHWGFDHTAITRRLARRWQLPDWLRVVIGHLDLPVASAVALGADAALFSTVQLAVVLTERSGASLGLLPGMPVEPLLERLHLGLDDLFTIQDRFRGVDLAEAFEPDWLDPRAAPELPSVLQTTIERRRSEAAPFLAPLERDLDRLHKMLLKTRTGEEDRLRNGKLAALAEFAAGASHEINNPLAVISGQSQYLLNRVTDEHHRRALESIVRQTQRVHSILTELMQFARPPQLVKRKTALGDVLLASVAACKGMAEEAEVKLDCILPSATVWSDVDPRHFQTAVGCLVRNAIEAAAPGKGWASVRLEVTSAGTEILIEDSGPGPTPAQREHLFDPFFSGRTAGRGRGLGLPTAWRLAREHGGDVRHVPILGGPTRFVLSLPLPEPAALAERISA